MDKITLDRDVFKALASDTRLDILKKLDVRQKTVTELAKELDLDKSTVFEHLEKLAAAKLVQKVEEDVERKWVYYQLSWTGRRLLHPEKITLAVLLSISGGALLSALGALWVWLRSAQAPVPSAPKTAAPLAAPQAATVPSSGALDPVWLAVAIGFALVALAGIGIAVWVRSKARAAAASA